MPNGTYTDLNGKCLICLIYQATALLSPKITLIFTPLVALIADQVLKLHSLQINEVHTLVRNATNDNINNIINTIQNNPIKPKYKLIYLAPETYLKTLSVKSCVNWMIQNNLVQRISLDPFYIEIYKPIHCKTKPACRSEFKRHLISMSNRYGIRLFGINERPELYQEGERVLGNMKDIYESTLEVSYLSKLANFYLV